MKHEKSNAVAREKSLLDLELAIHEQVNLNIRSDSELEACAAQLLLQLSERKWTGQDISEAIDEIVADAKRDSALLLIRLAAIPDLLPQNTPSNQIQRKVVSIVERAAPDISRFLRLHEKSQNFEKYELISRGHEVLCNPLSVLKELPSTLEEIERLSTEIERALKHDKCNSYLHSYGWTALRSKISNLSDQIRALLRCKDYTFKEKFDHLKAEISELREIASEHRSFVTYEFVDPFVAKVEAAVRALEDESAERFASLVEPKRKPPQVADKRYPLYQEGRYITVSIPLVNTGPGIAIGCFAEIGATGSSGVLVEQDEIRLGDIPPGDFALVFRILVAAPVRKADLAIQLTWRQLFGQSCETVFDVVLMSQDPNVDWGMLEALAPYGLEEADGETFVGRAAKVQAIANRLMKQQMTSTYITGQKRVGKTSLAKAVLRYIEGRGSERIYLSHYLEYGEYSTADAAGTVRALGEQIFEFLRPHIPHGMRADLPDFTGTLAPLNAVARAIEASTPQKRFIIVLDEFDNIHPEMYRYGPLAEAFFSNLRTLSTRKNLAFLLVGGEGMPFIIGAQGHQLNRFVCEPLDYFSRSGEWSDYVELVTKPVKFAVNWDDEAIQALFTLTSGHPYFTNLLCGKVFSRAVAERDTDVIASNIHDALQATVPELDTNAFAHLWKDGIEPGREPAEVTELRRLRFLVALGRSLRSNKRSSIADIAKSIGSLKLRDHEIRPVMEDFQRRDIMSEHPDGLTFKLPVFENWLKEVGVKKLIANTFADELEAELRRAEDEAFVTAAEVQKLAATWDPYRGRKISSEDVRAFLEQVASNQDRRLLFKILEHVKFVSTLEIEKMLERAHEKIVRSRVGDDRIGRKNEKRRDLWVTFFDGAGKSGNTYARRYAKESDISLADCVMEPSRLAEKLSACDPHDAPRAIIVVDDLIGSGKTMADNLTDFVERYGDRFSGKNIPLFVVSLLATEEGEKLLRRRIGGLPMAVTVHICEYVPPDCYAFSTDSRGFWADDEERDRAKSLCRDLGQGLFKDPLGYASQGLLVTFPDTCPNNALPILFASGSDKKPWTPLFPRHTT